MGNNKYKETINKNEKILFIILVMLAIIFKIYEIEIAFGMALDISFAFIIIILLCFGMEKAIITEIIISGIYIVVFKGEFIQIIEIIQIIFLGLYLKKIKLNVILGEFIFWTIFMLPIIYSIVFMGGSDEFRDYYKFTVLFLMVNGLTNAFIAEIIYVYFIRLKIYKKKLMIKYKDVILHILTLAIVIPFIINLFIDLKNSYSNICNTIEASSEEIYYYIKDEIEGWQEKSITNLQLSGIIEVGIIEDTIKKIARYKPYNIEVINENKKEILGINNYGEEILKSEDCKNKKISENLAKVIPKKDERPYFDNSWIDSYFLYKKKIDNANLEVRVEIPTKVYNKKLIKEHISRFELLLGISTIIGMVVLLLNKIIFNSLEKLSIITKNLPEKLYKNISITWPKSPIEEIEFLGSNIENTSLTLRENFVKLNETQNKLYELAYYDGLTGLPNRSYFKQYLDDLIFKCEDLKICVMFVDLNRFKLINDTWGHCIGDKLLAKVSERFKKLVSYECNVFRLGGDEFVFVTRVKNNKEIEEIGKRIIDSFKNEFKVDDLFLETRCSLGASIYPDHSTDIDTIIKYADIAMYASKENGGNYLQIFNNEINEKTLEKIKLEKEISKALENNEFILYYQPKFNRVTEKVSSLEALIRWINPNTGMIPPNKFIPIAEETDLILEIDKWVIFEACKQNKILQDEGFKKVPISVNVSAKHFSNRKILNVINEAIDKSGLEPKYLKIEITEGVLIKNVGMVSQMIIELKRKGVQVSIDDFGKGYSSINQLMSLPINEVKIDKDFIKGINTEYKKKEVVKLIVEIAHSLSLNVVAEGIETEEEKEYLKNIKCDELQGFLFSKPVELDMLKKML